MSILKTDKRPPRLISVIGPNAAECSSDIYSFGENIGKILVNKNWVIVCGGMDGFMKAVCEGARSSENYFWGATIGILPSLNKHDSNNLCDIIIPTGIGYARNTIVANTGEVVLAVAGGAGTLSEIAFAWQFNKPIACYEGFGGWSERLCEMDLDKRKHGLISKVSTTNELIQWLNER